MPLCGTPCKRALAFTLRLGFVQRRVRQLLAPPSSDGFHVLSSAQAAASPGPSPPGINCDLSEQSNNFLEINYPHTMQMLFPLSRILGSFVWLPL